MSLFSRVFRRKTLGILNWPDRNAPWNWWQINRPLSQADYRAFGPVYACWAQIAQQVCRAPVRHVQTQADGSVSLVTTKAPARVFRTPNSFQSSTDLLLNITQSLLADGNAYAFATRNNRFEISGLYPLNPKNVSVHIADSGEWFYQVGDSERLKLTQTDVNAGYWFPARDVLHIRLFTIDHPLVGVSPLTAAAAGVTAGLNINNQVAAFFGNMGRPSGIISHPKRLEPEMVRRIKERFVEATTGQNSGAPVVLGEGMAWAPMTMSAVDAELIASAKLSALQVAQVYGVPPFLLGDMTEAKYATVEAMLRHFHGTCLGFYLDHIGSALTRFFELPASETIELDYESVILRSVGLEDRMRAFKEGVQGGILSPDEARAKDRLPPVPFGSDVRVQQQMVPLSYGAMLQPPVPTGTGQPEPEEPEDETEEPEDETEPEEPEDETEPEDEPEEPEDEPEEPEDEPEEPEDEPEDPEDDVPRAAKVLYLEQLLKERMAA